MIVPIHELFETHLTVADLQRAMDFYGGVLGLELARAFPERKVAFYWIGGAGKAMLGLWEAGTGPLQMKLHLAFTVELPDLLEAPARLRAANVTPRDFAGSATDEPVVLAWMCSFSLLSGPGRPPTRVSVDAVRSSATRVGSRRLERLAAPSRRRGNANLIQMMHQVPHIVLGHVSQGNRRIRPDAAHHFQLGGGQVADHVGQIAVVARPKVHQHRPRGAFHCLYADRARRIVGGEFQRVGQRRPHESLMIVRGGVDQVPQQLLPRPAAGQGRPATLVFAHLAEENFRRIDYARQFSGDMLHGYILAATNAAPTIVRSLPGCAPWSPARSARR